MTVTTSRSVWPVTDAGSIVLMLIGGLVATIVFDLFGQWFAPSFIDGSWRLAPEPLATQSLQVVFGEFADAPTYGAVLHWTTGIVFYPIGYVFVALPLARSVVRDIPWPVVAVAYGVVLWAFALYVMAHLVSGNPPFLGWTNITWSALTGHVLYALVLGLILSRRT